MRGFWSDFGEVLERCFAIIVLFLLYYPECRVGKALIRFLEVILILCGMIFDSFLHDFGGSFCVILLLLFI